MYLPVDLGIVLGKGTRLGSQAAGRRVQIGSLKSAAVKVFTPKKLASTTNHRCLVFVLFCFVSFFFSFFLVESVVKHSPVHPWWRGVFMSVRKDLVMS